MNTPPASPGAESSESLPTRLCETLRAEIVASYEPGDKLPSMRALRDRFGVSINTIGAALDMLARDGLVEKRHGSGVYVAESSAAPRIGILSELDLFDVRISAYFRTVAGELKRQAQEQGAEPRLYVGNAAPGDADEEPTCPQFWTDAAAGELDGAVILDTPAGPSWRARMERCTVPAVGFMTGYATEIDFHGITTAAVQRLAAEGCRRIGLLAGHMEQPFIATVAACGLRTDAAWIRCQRDPALRGTGWDAFREIWLAGDERPDGLVVLDDMLFADAQLAMLELGVAVPTELRIALLTSAGASPTMRVPVHAFETEPADMAAGMLDILLCRMRGEEPAEPVRHVPFREVLMTTPSDVAAT